MQSPSPSLSTEWLWKTSATCCHDVNLNEQYKTNTVLTISVVPVSVISAVSLVVSAVSLVVSAPATSATTVTVLIVTAVATITAIAVSLVVTSIPPVTWNFKGIKGNAKCTIALTTHTSNTSPLWNWSLTSDPLTLGRSCQKRTLVSDHEYVIPSKFHQNPLSESGEEVKNVNCWQDGRMMDGEWSQCLLESLTQVTENYNHESDHIYFDIHYTMDFFNQLL